MDYEYKSNGVMSTDEAMAQYKKIAKEAGQDDDLTASTIEVMRRFAKEQGIYGFSSIEHHKCDTPVKREQREQEEEEWDIDL